MKANYFNHHSLRLLVGNILLTIPSLCAVLITVVWNIDFLILPPVLTIIGWVLVLPVTYTIERTSKERVAIDALACGLLMLCLCSLMASARYIFPVKGALLALSEEHSIPAYFDQEGLLCKKLIIRRIPPFMTQEGLRLRIEEIKLGERI